MNHDNINNIIEIEGAKQLLAKYKKIGFGDRLLDLINIQYSNKFYTSYSDLSKLIAESLGFTPDVFKDKDAYRITSLIENMAIDISNQFSAMHNHLTSSGLGFEWYRYSGSNLTNTRVWCLAMTKRGYFHYCEIDNLVNGKFEEFKELGGVIDKETSKPKGLYPSTNISNIFILRGGYGCGHQICPVSEDLVPDDTKERIYNSNEYKKFKTYIK